MCSGIVNLNDTERGALLFAAPACLTLILMPLVWPLLGMLISFFTGQGLLNLIDFLFEAKETAKTFQDGTYIERVKELYILAFFAGAGIFLLFVVVSALSLIASLLSARLARLFEIIAVVMWVGPLWIYRGGCFLILVTVAIGVVWNFILAFKLVLETSGILEALIGGFFTFGLLLGGSLIVYIGFLAAYGPVYLCLRYVVSLGLIFARPDGLARNWLKRACDEGGHFPFWVGM